MTKKEEILKRARAESLSMPTDRARLGLPSFSLASAIREGDSYLERPTFVLGPRFGRMFLEEQGREYHGPGTYEDRRWKLVIQVNIPTGGQL